LVAACGRDLAAPDLVGEWGGEHILLTLVDSGASLEYDCARGTMVWPVDPDADGGFETTGIHVLEHGGPVIESEEPDEHPASYLGWTDGSNMTLHIRLLDSGDSVGTFSLIRGRQAQLFKCL
jgi:hypothetical protein